MPSLPLQKAGVSLWLKVFRVRTTVLSSDLRARISELRRSAARRPISSNPEELETIGEGGLELPPPSVIPRATADDARIRFRLNDVIEGREAITPPGRFFLIDRDVDELLPRRGPELTRRFSQLIRKINGQTEIEHDEHDTFQSLLHTGPGALAFVDIEATGFTPGTPLFLVGLIPNKLAWIQLSNAALFSLIRNV